MPYAPFDGCKTRFAEMNADRSCGGELTRFGHRRRALWSTGRRRLWVRHLPAPLGGGCTLPKRKRQLDFVAFTMWIGHETK